jgi:hypothetical protein
MDNSKEPLSLVDNNIKTKKMYEFTLTVGVGLCLLLAFYAITTYYEAAELADELKSKENDGIHYISGKNRHAERRREARRGSQKRTRDGIGGHPHTYPAASSASKKIR